MNKQIDDGEALFYYAGDGSMWRTSSTGGMANIKTTGGGWLGYQDPSFQLTSTYTYTLAPTNQIQQIQKENVEMKGLWTVYLVYGGDRNKIVSFRVDDVVASDVEDAKIKSGLYAKVDAKWDADYLTICATKVCDIKIKSKPTEIKNV